MIIQNKEAILKCTALFNTNPFYSGGVPGRHLNILKMGIEVTKIYSEFLCFLWTLYLFLYQSNKQQSNVDLTPNKPTVLNPEKEAIGLIMILTSPGFLS
jgi:hypothetical protein